MNNLIISFISRYSLFLLVISIFFLSGCAQSPHKSNVSNHNAALLETERFNRSVKLEVKQYPDSARLIKALDLILNESDPSRRLVLIKPWIDKSDTPLLTKAEQPYLWIKLNWLVADAYKRLNKNKNSNDLNKHISHYEDIIQIFPHEEYPIQSAALRNDLANVLIRLPNEKRVENLEKVIELTQQVLQIRTHDKFPDEWAKAQIIRAKAYQERLLGDRTSNLKFSAELFEQALDVQTQRTFPGDFLTTVYELSVVLLELKQYAKALYYIEKALEINEHELLQHDILSDQAKYLVSQAHSLFANAVWANVQLENYNAAIQIMEQGKSRLLKKVLSSNTPHLVSSNFYQELSILPSDSVIIAPVFSDLGTIIFILKPGITNIDESNVINISKFTRKDLYELMRGGMSGKWGGYMATYRNLKSRGLKSWESNVTKVFDIFSSNWIGQTLFRIQQLNVKLGSKLIWIVDSDTNLLPISSINFEGKPLLASYHIQFVPSIYNAVTAQKNLKKEKRDHINLVINPTSDPYLEGTEVESKLIQKYFPSKIELLGSQATIENFEQLIKSTPSAYFHIASHGTHAIVDTNANNSGLILKDIRVFSIRNLLNLPPNQFDATRLVVLSACETNFVDISMPFESLGMPATFLQVGVPGVISTLWLVDDVATTLIMAKFYEYHRKYNLEPVIALTKSQLWLRSATYESIEKVLSNYWSKKTIQKKIMASTSKSRVMNKNDTPFTDRYFWAGFAYTGM